jgi:hypothetical protein
MPKQIKWKVASVWFAFLFMVFLFNGKVSGQNKKLSATEAKAHIGENATVCGRVVSARYATASRGKPTFLNFDREYPHEVFTIVIWGENREKFGNPEEKYRNQEICVSGRITEYRGLPEVVASDPTQITIDAK